MRINIQKDGTYIINGKKYKQAYFVGEFDGKQIWNYTSLDNESILVSIEKNHRIIAFELFDSVKQFDEIYENGIVSKAELFIDNVKYL